MLVVHLGGGHVISCDGWVRWMLCRVMDGFDGWMSWDGWIDVVRWVGGFDVMC